MARKDENAKGDNPPGEAQKDGMLTPSEIASLRRDANEKSAYARKAFAHMRPKKADGD